MLNTIVAAREAHTPLHAGAPALAGHGPLLCPGSNNALGALSNHAGGQQQVPGWLVQLVQ
jgi:hypothetical protein